MGRLRSGIFFVFLFVGIFAEATGAPRLSDITADSEIGADESDELNSRLFLLALGHMGYAGGKTGICVDYVNGESPQFRISVDTDRAFQVGKSELNALQGGFDARKLNQLLAYFQQYRVATGQAKSSDRLNMTIHGYADPQHYENASNIDESIQRNRELARDRARTIEEQLRADAKMGAILSTHVEGVPSATLEKRYPKSNSAYAKDGKSLLACDTRRKVVMTTDVLPADIAESARRAYRPAHRMASAGLRNHVAGQLNSRFHAELAKIDPKVSPEVRAVAATQALLADPALPEVCRQEPLASVIAFQVLGVEGATRGQSGSLAQTLKRDNFKPRALGISFSEDDLLVTENASSVYDMHRTLLAIESLGRADLRESLKREPTREELRAHLSDAKRSSALVAELKGGKSKRLKVVQEAILAVTSAQGTPRKKGFWSLGGGSAAFQCFDVSKSMKDYLATSHGKASSLKSGAELLRQNGSGSELSIVVDPGHMHEVKPAEGQSFLFDKPGSRPILACKYCGYGLHYDEKSKKLESYDRTLGSNGEPTTDLLKKLGQDPGRVSFGALMAPVTYVVPNCSDCACADIMEKIQSCKGAEGSTSGVAQCSNGVRKISPLETSGSTASIKLSKSEAEQACVFTPPSFHSCAIGPEGKSEDASQKVKPKFEFFDPVLKKYVAREAASMNEMMSVLSKEWGNSCGTGAVDVARQSPEDVIEDVMCRGSGQQGFPTGDDKKDCPAL